MAAGARQACLGALLCFVSAVAYAHEDGLGGAGFLSGLLHPALGLDHLVAMLSVGVVSALIGGRAIWLVPATFVLVMILGSFVAMAGIDLPFVESGIAASVLVLGLAILGHGHLPRWAAFVCVAFFATFHGHAHGTEMPEIANPYAYGAGFVLGTSLIHLLGVGIGFATDRASSGETILRAMGVLFALFGAFLLFGG